MHCMPNRYTIIVSMHYFTYFHKGFLQKKQVRDDEVCVSAGGQFSGVGGGNFRTPIASLISNVTSTRR